MDNLNDFYRLISNYLIKILNVLSHRHIQYNETQYGILLENRNLNHSSIIISDNNIKNINLTFLKSQ